jgi:hypothetical protein
MQKTSMVGQLGGGARDPEAVTEIREHPLSMLETSMVGPLGGNAGDLGARTIN